MVKKDFIVGCGYTGLRLAAQRIIRGHDVFALSHTRERCQLLRDRKINVTLGDLDQQNLLALPKVRYANVFYFAPPNSAGHQDKRTRFFLHAMDNIPFPRRIVYISTTGVYGDAQGAWVDEESVLNPLAINSKKRMEAEQYLKKWCALSAVNLTILRVAGIYGSGRLPIVRLKQGLKVLKSSEAPMSNRIHIDDLVNICDLATSFDDAFDIINVADGSPTPMSDYFIRVAAKFGLPAPKEINRDQAAQEFSPTMMSYLNESKRVSNKKLREKFAYSLLYSNLESGLAACELSE